MLSCRFCEPCLARQLPPVPHAPHLLLHPARGAAGAVGRLRGAPVPRPELDRAQDRSRAAGRDSPCSSTRSAPASAGRSRSRAPARATPSLILGPGPARPRQRDRLPRGGRGEDHRHGPRRRRAQARAGARASAPHPTIDVENEDAKRAHPRADGRRGARRRGRRVVVLDRAGRRRARLRRARRHAWCWRA